jgi:hypothetical protein
VTVLEYFETEAISRNCSTAASRSLTFFLCDGIRIRKVVGFFEAFVSEPEYVEAGFVAVDEFLDGLATPLGDARE